jgi:hypothetical protein
LTQPDTYQRYSERSRAIVEQYTFDVAATGLVEACRHASSRIEKKKKEHKAKSR